MTSTQITEDFESLVLTGQSQLITAIKRWPKVSDKIKKIPKNPVIAISLSRRISPDLTSAGHSVLLEIGPIHEIPPHEMTRIAEDITIIISRVHKLINKTITLVFACPVAISFLVGSILGHQVKYKLLHWDRKYKKLVDYSLKRYTEQLSKGFNMS